MDWFIAPNANAAYIFKSVLQLLTYKSLTFSEEIEKIDTVRAYHVSLLLTLVVFLYSTSAFATEWTGMVSLPGESRLKMADNLWYFFLLRTTSWNWTLSWTPTLLSGKLTT